MEISEKPRTRFLGELYFGVDTFKDAVGDLVAEVSLNTGRNASQL